MEGIMETNKYASNKQSINTIKSNKSPIQFENPWRLQLEVVSQERTRKSWSFCFNSLRAWEPPDNTSNSIHSQPTLLQQNVDTFLKFHCFQNPPDMSIFYLIFFVAYQLGGRGEVFMGMTTRQPRYVCFSIRHAFAWGSSQSNSPGWKALKWHKILTKFICKFGWFLQWSCGWQKPIWCT